MLAADNEIFQKGDMKNKRRFHWRWTKLFPIFQDPCHKESLCESIWKCCYKASSVQKIWGMIKFCGAFILHCGILQRLNPSNAPLKFPKVYKYFCLFARALQVSKWITKVYDFDYCKQESKGESWLNICFISDRLSGPKHSQNEWNSRSRPKTAVPTSQRTMLNIFSYLYG